MGGADAEVGTHAHLCDADHNTVHAACLLLEYHAKFLLKQSCNFVLSCFLHIYLLIPLFLQSYTFPIKTSRKTHTFSSYRCLITGLQRASTLHGQQQVRVWQLWLGRVGNRFVNGMEGLWDSV